MEKYCISVDWLQTYCLGNQVQAGVYEKRGYQFLVNLTSRETAQFKLLFEVWHKGHVVAEIQQLPRTSVINRRATIVKLSNRVLYSSIYIDILYAIHEALSLTYKGITRIDICYDCNKFAGGRSPSRFINNFVSVPMGSNNCVYRKGSDVFAAYGKKSASSSAKISSIRFGSEKSRVGTYIYDKTLELKEVKDKPWIRKVWKDNGLISTPECHVFRSEISIKAQGTDILNMSTGELFRLSPRYLEHANQVEKLFHVYAHKFFDFRICRGQKLARNYDKLYLFEYSGSITVKPYYISSMADTGRMEKICYNKLKKLSTEYSDLSEQMRFGLTTAMDFLSALSGIKLSTVRLKHYEQYLDSFLGRHFIASEEIAYLCALEECRVKRQAIDAEQFYDIFSQNIDLPPLIVDYDNGQYFDELSFT